MSNLIDKDIAVEIAARRYRKFFDEWKEHGDYGDFCAAAAYRRAAYELDKLTPVPTETILCKDCKYRPIATRADEGIFYGGSLYFPDDRCPLECDDPWYNRYPEDDFYCANAERKEK